MSSRLFLRRITQNLHSSNRLFAARLPNSKPESDLAPLCFCNQSTIYSSAILTQKQSGLGSITLVISAGIGVIGGSIIYYYQLTKHQHVPTLHQVEASRGFKDQPMMAGTIPPGRPGNLTADQEEKLKEFWKATFRVFGVPIRGGPELSESVKSSIDLPEDTNTSSLEKNKKKKRNLFSRKHNVKASEESIGTHPDASEADDKFGQNKNFQEALANQSPESLRQAFWSMVKHDHPDGLLLRFLRARKWDVEKALVMLIATMQWRSQEMHVDDDVIKNGEGAALVDSSSSNPVVKREGDDFLAQLRLGKSFLHGTDKDGRPICFVRVRYHKQGEQTEASLERVTVHIIETARLLLSPPVDTAAIVFDMTGFSMANMDYGPVKFMVKCFEANYPESLGVVLVHKSPWVFQGIWTIIKGWLDPVVASKVHFTKTLEELEQFVPKTHIIKELGGDDPWTYQYAEPVPGENAPMEDSATREKLLEARTVTVQGFEDVTQEWIQGSQTDNTVTRRRNEIAEQLRTGYWQLDPYLRARTLYDRTGMIREGGMIEYYPSANGHTAAAVKPDGPVPASHQPDDLD